MSATTTKNSPVTFVRSSTENFAKIELDVFPPHIQSRIVNSLLGFWKAQEAYNKRQDARYTRAMREAAQKDTAFTGGLVAETSLEDRHTTVMVVDDGAKLRRLSGWDGGEQAVCTDADEEVSA